jgi:AcrR family transcriptional regulator
LELFRKHGFKKVTVEEICKNAEVSKMTFYKFFKNKPDLVDKVWENQFELGMQQFEEIEKMDIPFTKKIQMFLKLKEENTKKFGPGFVEDYIEFMPEFLKTYSTQYNIAMQRFQDFIKVHQEKGEVRADMRPEFFLKVVAKLMELAQDKELIESYDSIKDFALEVNNFMYYGIMPAPEDKSSGENE